MGSTGKRDDATVAKTTGRRPLHVVPAPDEPDVGETIAGRYVVIETLGRGGHGAVYRAKDTLLDRDVALKIVDERRADHALLGEALTAEARALARLKHPGIVAVHDAGESGGRHFLTMELVDGRHLAEIVEGGAVPLRQALAWTTALAHALDTAHVHGVIHGDVKPRNVLLDREGHVRLVDFGLARIKRRASPDPDVISGSPGYTAPEVWGGAIPGSRADLFSLAATFHALVTGKAPVEGATTDDIATGSLSRKAPAADERKPGLPRPVARVLSDALAREPERRPASGRALVRRLRRAIWGRLALRAAAVAAVVVPLAAWGASVLLAPPLEIEARLMAERWDAETGTLVPTPVHEGLALHEGDAIWLEDVTANAGTEVRVFLLDPRGSLGQLEPPEPDGSAPRLAAGAARRLPEKLVWRLDDAVGTETVFVVAGLRSGVGSGAASETVERASLAARQAAPERVAQVFRGAAADAPRSAHSARERAVEEELRKTFEVVRVMRFNHR